ncbi:endolytic transglycosylase MltG [Salidesulfovibrio onnuriiensis]|uniref:endolytic transglycosylase MltG n=1 Tax=Salidesulfovibrio onnuriiensis TaxID=2583823 RepID=UPI0011C948F4|nr:endolytic transglycosylase MltG [Salidesulfovibrio onnuriiensis]
MARKRTLLITTLLLALCIGGVCAHFAYKAWQEHRFLTVPPETPGRPVEFVVEKGQPLSTIARNLKKAGVITESRRFTRLAALNHKGGSVRAGRFLLNTGWTPGQVLDVLTTTPGILERIGIREGLPWWEVAHKVEEAGMGSFEDFDRAVHDTDLLRQYGIQAESAEGYLFPETYLLSPPETGKARYMAETMLKQFFVNAQQAWPGGLPPWEEMHRVVTLASIVEKETGAAQERIRIAGVFANRLKKHMLLQTDPTIIYGLGPRFDGNLTRKHLRDTSNPYNTYTKAGLPPGPICSPGLESILAAQHPEEHRYLYFVAKGDGTHHFSRTLKEHNDAVVKYQIRRNRKTYRSAPQTAEQ